MSESVSTSIGQVHVGATRQWKSSKGYVQLQRVPAGAGIPNVKRFQRVLIARNQHSGPDRISYQKGVLDIWYLSASGW
jgi:hypothetical protein